VTRTYAVDPWAEKPLQTLVAEAGARLALLMTPAGQVIAQHGFTRAVDCMAAAALGAGIVASTGEVARLLNEPLFSVLNHQGERHGILLAAFDTPRGRLVCLVVYGPESSPGLVQLFYEEFCRDVRDACPAKEAPKAVLAADFERELHDSLTALFRT
jgi:hypothetical protein